MFECIFDAKHSSDTKSLFRYSWTDLAYAVVCPGLAGLEASPHMQPSTEVSHCWILCEVSSHQALSFKSFVSI